MQNVHAINLGIFTNNTSFSARCLLKTVLSNQTKVLKCRITCQKLHKGGLTIIQIKKRSIDTHIFTYPKRIKIDQLIYKIYWCAVPYNSTMCLSFFHKYY